MENQSNSQKVQCSYSGIKLNPDAPRFCKADNHRYCIHKKPMRGFNLESFYICTLVFPQEKREKILEKI